MSTNKLYMCIDSQNHPLRLAKHQLERRKNRSSYLIVDCIQVYSVWLNMPILFFELTFLLERTLVPYSTNIQIVVAIHQ